MHRFQPPKRRCKKCVNGWIEVTTGDDGTVYVKRCDCSMPIAPPKQRKTPSDDFQAVSLWEWMARQPEPEELAISKLLSRKSR